MPFILLGPFTEYRPGGEGRIRFRVDKRNRYAPSDWVELNARNIRGVWRARGREGPEYIVLYYTVDPRPYLGYAWLHYSRAEPLERLEYGMSTLWEGETPEEPPRAAITMNSVSPSDLIKMGMITRRNLEAILDYVGLKPKPGKRLEDLLWRDAGEEAEFDLKPPLKRMIIQVKNGRYQVLVEDEKGRVYAMSGILLHLGVIPRGTGVERVLEGKVLGGSKTLKLLLEDREAEPPEPAEEEPPEPITREDLESVVEHAPEWADAVVIERISRGVSATPARKSRYGPGYYAGITWREIRLPEDLAARLEAWLPHDMIIVTREGEILAVKRAKPGARYINYEVEELEKLKI